MPEGGISGGELSTSYPPSCVDKFIWLCGGGVVSSWCSKRECRTGGDRRSAGGIRGRLLYKKNRDVDKIYLVVPRPFIIFVA